jgi:hypothetical protein
MRTTAKDYTKHPTPAAMRAVAAIRRNPLASSESEDAETLDRETSLPEMIDALGKIISDTEQFDRHGPESWLVERIADTAKAALQKAEGKS